MLAPLVAEKYLRRALGSFMLDSRLLRLDCRFHWTLADLLNSLADVGLSLRRLRELPATCRTSLD
ncbi:hypothetical protein ACFL6X_02150 [Candidatus Latescibacterota bacterium]